MRLAVFMLLVSSLLPLRAAAEAPCVRTVRWEANQPPYNLRLPNGQHGGYYADLVAEALRRMDCRARFVEMRWQRGVYELQAGRLDIVAGLLRNPEREASMWFTRGVNLSPNRLYLTAEARRRHPALRTLADLRGTTLTVGAESGARYGGGYNMLLADPAFSARLHFTPYQKTGWEMLAHGRLDGVISDDVRAYTIGLPMQPPGRGVEAVLTIAEAPALIGLSRRSVSAEFADRFDAVLGEMVADGSLVQLRERYIPCATDPVTLACRRPPVSR